LSYNQLSEEIRLVELDMRFEILIEAPAYDTLVSLERAGTTFYAICSREHILYRGTTLYTNNSSTDATILCVCVCDYIDRCIMHTYTYIVCVCVCVCLTSFIDSCIPYTPRYPQTRTQTRKTETNERY
jgi:hypothetical protein